MRGRKGNAGDGITKAGHPKNKVREEEKRKLTRRNSVVNDNKVDGASVAVQVYAKRTFKDGVLFCFVLFTC